MLKQIDDLAIKALSQPRVESKEVLKVVILLEEVLHAPKFQEWINLKGNEDIAQAFH